MSLHKIIPWLVSILSASEIKDITNTAICLLHTISYNTKQKSSMRTDKDQHFTTKEAIIDFTVVNFSFICSNIAATPVCGVYVFSVLMRFLCKTSHKDSCAWPCLTWHCQTIKSAEYNQWSRFYDCCSNIDCRLSRSKKASNINFTWILTDFP